MPTDQLEKMRTMKSSMTEFLTRQIVKSAGSYEPSTRHRSVAVTESDRVRTVVGLLENALWAWAGISIHQGETKMWNRAGVEPPGCEILERVARIQDLSAHVWRGPELPAELQGLNILGTPLGNPEFVRAHLAYCPETSEVIGADSGGSRCPVVVVAFVALFCKGQLYDTGC